MTRTSLWRNAGRPEAALVGVQFLATDNGKHKGPFRVRASPAASWIFAGTGLEAGSRFGHFGIEIDHTNRFSPRGVDVVADIRDLFAPGKTAQMTYYETASGAKVFAAGAFTLAGAALSSPVSAVLENLWGRLSTEGEPAEPAA